MRRAWIITLFIIVVALFAGGRQALAQTKSKFIPDCTFEAKLGGECTDVSIFITLLINISKYLFSIIGALALLFFVYGGFVLIFSSGNPEKVKHGFEIFKAAVIGLIIVFGAYMLVRFMGSAVGLREGFKLL